MTYSTSIPALQLAIVVPVLDAFGESVVNVSVVCPEMSTVSSSTS